MIGGNAFSRGAEEFDAALQGRAGGEVAERYAELLDVVSAIRAVPQPAPRAQFVTDLRERLMVAAAEMPKTAPADKTTAATALRLTPRQRRGARDRRIAALVGGFAVVAATGSMAVASQSSLPGDVLYPVKRAIENAHVNLQSSAQARAKVMLDNADTRLTEVEQLSERRDDADADEISSTLQDFKEQTDQASSVALDDFNSNGDTGALNDVRSFASSSMGRLSALDDLLPTAARPALIAAAQTVKSVDQSAYDACPTCTEDQVTKLPDFATQPLSASIKQLLGGGHPDNAGTTTQQGANRATGTSTDPTGGASQGPSAATSPGASPTGPLQPPALPPTAPTNGTGGGTTQTHHGVVTGTLDQLTKTLLGSHDSGQTSGSGSDGASTDSGDDGGLLGAVTGLLGLGG